MADIKQAAKWMAQGKRVKRSLWLRDQRIGCAQSECIELFYTDGIRKVHEPFVLMNSDLLTDDWEIAP